MLLPPNYDFYFEIGEGLYLLLYLVKQQDELKQIVLDRTSDTGEKNLGVDEMFWIKTQRKLLWSIFRSSCLSDLHSLLGHILSSFDYALVPASCRELQNGFSSSCGSIGYGVLLATLCLLLRLSEAGHRTASV